jgi:hypothetical protein
MTFKHSKFIDSATMRSFEKIAIEKKMIMPDGLSKKASKKIDLTPSSDLMSNILTLCVGLKELGMERYASDLQKKFLNYKEASNAYETSGETGEDLINSAHPEGSHKLVGVEGDSLFETILDQQLKMINIVNKKPSGKLTNASSSKDIINTVKFSLGQNTKSNKEQLDHLNKTLNLVSDKILRTLNKIRDLANKDLTIPLGVGSGYTDSIKYASNLSVNNLNNLKVTVGRIYNGIMPHTTLGYEAGVTPETWATLEPSFGYINNLIETGLNTYNIIMTLSREDAEKEYSTPKVEKGTPHSDLNLWASRLQSEIQSTNQIIAKENKDMLDPNIRSKLSSRDLSYATKFIAANENISKDLRFVLSSLRDVSNHPEITVPEIFNQTGNFKGVTDTTDFDNKMAKIKIYRSKYNNYFGAK